MSFERNSSPPIAQNPGNNSLPRPSTRLQRFARRFPEGYVVPIAGGIAGAVSGFVSCPLDVIKTKLQAQGGFQHSSDGAGLTNTAYRGVSGTAATIWKEEGLRGMYRGLGPMLLGYVPTWAVYLTVYNKSQGYFRTKTGELHPESAACHPLTQSARQLVSCQCICFSLRRSMLNHGDQPNMGHQDSADVTIEFEDSDKAFKTTLAVSQHLACRPDDVPARRRLVFLFRPYSRPARPDTRCNSIPTVRGFQREIHWHWKGAKGERRRSKPSLLWTSVGCLLEQSLREYCYIST